MLSAPNNLRGGRWLTEKQKASSIAMVWHVMHIEYCKGCSIGQ